VGMTGEGREEAMSDVGLQEMLLLSSSVDLFPLLCCCDGYVV
jgi:hypothetical protein